MCITWQCVTARHGVGAGRDAGGAGLGAETGKEEGRGGEREREGRQGG